MKRAMQSAMRLNAKGIKVMLSGRLAGNEIARTEWLREGSIPSHTLKGRNRLWFCRSSYYLRNYWCQSLDL